MCPRCEGMVALLIGATLPRKRVGVPPAAERRGGVPPPHRLRSASSRRGSLLLDRREGPLESAQRPLARHALQVVLAAVGEPVPRAGDDVAHRR